MLKYTKCNKSHLKSLALFCIPNIFSTSKVTNPRQHLPLNLNRQDRLNSPAPVLLGFQILLSGFDYKITQDKYPSMQLILLFLLFFWTWHKDRPFDASIWIMLLFLRLVLGKNAMFRCRGTREPLVPLSTAVSNDIRPTYTYSCLLASLA